MSATNLLKTDMENREQNIMFTGPFILTNISIVLMHAVIPLLCLVKD